MNDFNDYLQKISAGRRERAKAVLELSAIGCSSDAVVQHLSGEYSLTRNMVIGIVDRARKSRVSNAERRSGTGILEAIRSKQSKPSRIMAANFAHAGSLPESAKSKPAPEKPSVALECAPCSILELSSARCRWIVGDPKQPFEAIYCGGKRVTKSYCRYHNAESVAKRGEAA